MQIRVQNSLPVITIAAITAIILFPVFAALSRATLWNDLLRLWSSDFGSVVARTLAFSTCSTIVMVPLAFFAAVAARKLSGLWSAVLAFCLVPALLGAVSVGFETKLLLQGIPLLSSFLSQREWVRVWSTMSVVQGLQLGPLFVYLFWLNLKTLPAARLEFAIVAGLCRLERVRDVSWPHSKNLGALLCLFSMVESLQEYSKFYLILHPSAGTASELVSHRLLRLYGYYVPSDPVLARNLSMAAAGSFVVVSVFAVAVVTVLVPRALDWALLFASRFRIRIPELTTARVFVSMIVPAVSVAPIALVLAHLSRESYPDLTFVTLPPISALFATVMVVLAAIAFGVWSRVVFEQVLKGSTADHYLCLLHCCPVLFFLLSRRHSPACIGLATSGMVSDHRPLCWRSLSRARLYLLFH